MTPKIDGPVGGLGRDGRGVSGIDGGITTALIGASKPSQVEDCVGAVGNLEFTAEELAEIDENTDLGDINLWARSSES